MQNDQNKRPRPPSRVEVERQQREAAEQLRWRFAKKAPQEVKVEPAPPPPPPPVQPNTLYRKFPRVVQTNTPRFAPAQPEIKSPAVLPVKPAAPVLSSVAAPGSYMRIYNGIFCCTRDNKDVPAHIESLKGLGKPMSHCLYYGMGQKPAPGINSYALGFHEIYENLPLKTYGMLKHALETCYWDRLLKTDVNSRVVSIDWEAVEQHDLVGYLALTATSTPGAMVPRLWDRRLPISKVSQPALLEAYKGQVPEWWVGGPAYIISRRLAERIVERGIWSARGFPAEDVMVCTIAMQHGMQPVDGISYFSDGQVQANAR